MAKIGAKEQKTSFRPQSERLVEVSEPAEVVNLDGEETGETDSGAEDSDLPPEMLPEGNRPPSSDYPPTPDAGRPRLDMDTAVEPAGARLPRPKFRLYKNDHANRMQYPVHFIKYWHGLPEWAKNRTIAYVYRDHPILKEPPKGPDGKPAWYKYIDKLAGNNPINDVLDVLRQYGCGDYHFTFNDSVTKKNGGEETLTMMYLTGMGGGDYVSNPPVDELINDVEKVDLDHPANKSYVAYLRGRGILPEQQGQRQQGDEMASTVVEQVLEQNKGLIAQVMESKKEENKSSGVDAAVIGVMADAAKTSNDMVKQSFTESMAVMKEAAKAAAPTSQTQAQGQGQQITLIDVLALVDKFAARSNPQDAEVIQLRARLAEIQDKQMDRLMKLLEQSHQPVTPFTSMKEGVEALKTLKSAVDEISGRGGDNDVAETVVDAAMDAGGPKWLKTAAPLIQGAIQLGGQVLGAWLMSRQLPMPQTMPQQQQYYPQPQYRPQGPPMGPQQPMGPLPIQIGGTPQQAQAQSMQPPPQPMQPPSQPQSQSQPDPSQIVDPNMIPPQVRTLIDNILPAVASHLTLDKDGTEFADWFILNYGERTFDMVKGYGPGELLKALSIYPPSAQVLSGFPPEKVQALIAEFCDPKFDEEEETGIKPAPTPPAAA